MTQRPLDETEWKLVPVEPLPEMVGAWYRVKNGHHFHDEPPPTDTSDYAAYRAMLAAAPVRAAPEPGWQTMDSAPKDEIVWLANENIMRLGFWQNGEKHENHGTVGGGWIDKALAEAGGVRGLTFAPTCWHRVPTFPAISREEA